MRTVTLSDVNVLDFTLVDEDNTPVSILGKTLVMGIAKEKDPSDSANDWLIIAKAKFTNLEDGDASLVGQFRLTTTVSDLTSLNELDQPKMFLVVADADGSNPTTHWGTFPYQLLKIPDVSSGFA